MSISNSVLYLYPEAESNQTHPFQKHIWYLYADSRIPKTYSWIIIYPGYIEHIQIIKCLSYRNTTFSKNILICFPDHHRNSFVPASVSHFITVTIITCDNIYKSKCITLLIQIYTLVFL